MKKTIFILMTGFSLHLNAQNLFPVKLNNCKTERFCLDCGDIKAGYDEEAFLMLQQKLNETLNLRGMKGAVKFQVLVDKKGTGCVLSHTDQSNNPISRAITKELNRFKKWTPAFANSKKEERTSINLLFTIQDNSISGHIERVDIPAFSKSFDRPMDPEVYNKSYDYKNENLKHYQVTVWNSHNSNLPDNMNDNMAIDKNGLIWLTIDEGLVTFDGKDFKKQEQDITNERSRFPCYALTADNDNIKWVYAKKNIYSFDNKNWKRYDSSDIGIDGAYEIVNNPSTGEVFFCSDEGLIIHKEGKWSAINRDNTRDLPSNRVAFAKRDAEDRIWIGTYGGSVMIDKNGKTTSFENMKGVLKGKCITSMDEDENGILYFSLYEFDRKGRQKVNNDEGIAIRYPDGTIKQFTTENSGMPFNHANHVLYDKNEKVLWISTDRAGLVRYDLKENWQNYHNKNSPIPTSYISTMTFDAQGNLFLETRQGLVKIERKGD